MTAHPSPRPWPPQYVERGGEVVYRQPFLATDVLMFAFVLRGDTQKLNALHDRVFNEPMGRTRFSAFGPYFALTFVDLPHLSAATPPDDRLGSTSEREVTFWLPVRDHEAPEIRWAVPYIYVDNGWAVAAGRETYGFPKQQGVVRFDRSDRAPDLLTADTLAFRRFGPSAVAEVARVLSVRRSTASPHPLTSEWLMVEDALRALRGPVETLAQLSAPLFSHPGTSLGFASILVRDLLGRGLPVVLLKQFRDALNPEMASFQAIVNAPCQVTNFHGAGFLPSDYRLTLDDLESQPVRRELGLPDGVLVPDPALWLHFDFTIGRGETLWEAGV